LGIRRPHDTGDTASPDGAWRTSLLEAIRITIKADSDPVRQTLFARLREEDRVARIVTRVHGWLGRSRAASALVSLYGLKTYLSIDDAPDARDGIMAVAVFVNARRHIAEVTELLHEHKPSIVSVSSRNIIRPRTLLRLLRVGLSPMRCIRFVKVVHATNQANFLVACRVASTIAAYMRWTEVLKVSRPRAVLVASDSNPEEVAIKVAARTLGVPSIFASHAYTTPVSPPLRFDLSILEGQAALASFEAKGPVRGTTVFRGIDGESVPLDPKRFERATPTIGIFAPKAVGWDAFTRIITDCHQRFPGCKILIRWHPNMLGEPRLGELRGRPDVIETPASAKVGEIVGQCDWGIADENSNVVLDMLKRGVPVLTVQNLTTLPPERGDLYGFLRNAIVFPQVSSIAALDIPSAMKFYTGAWAERFASYDASYLRDPADVKRSIVTSVARLLDRQRQ
jgi:hypothetical protein